MTLPTASAASETGSAPRPWLGAAVVRRMRLPGPPLDRPLPSRIGTLASGVQRFALSTSRPVEIRRALAGPDPSFGGAMRPPRWWVPTSPRQAGDDHTPDTAATVRTPVFSGSDAPDAPSGRIPGATASPEGATASAAQRVVLRRRAADSPNADSPNAGPVTSGVVGGTNVADATPGSVVAGGAGHSAHSANGPAAADAGQVAATSAHIARSTDTVPGAADAVGSGSASATETSVGGSLGGSQAAGSASSAAEAVAPWLTPATTVDAAELEERGLPRAARTVPNEETYSPGGLLSGLTGRVAPVRRHAEVVAAGPMLVAADQARLRRTRAQRTPEVQAPPASAAAVASVATPRETTSRPQAGSRPDPGASDGSEGADRAVTPGAPSGSPEPRPAAVDTGSAAPQLRRTPVAGGSVPAAGPGDIAADAPATAEAPESIGVAGPAGLPGPIGAHRTRFVDTLRHGSLSQLPPAVSSLRAAATASGDRRLTTGSEVPQDVQVGTGDLLRRSSVTGGDGAARVSASVLQSRHAQSEIGEAGPISGPSSRVVPAAAGSSVGPAAGPPAASAVGGTAPADGPELGSGPRPGTRRDRWAAGSLVMRQANVAGEVSGSSHDAPVRTVLRRHRATSAVPTVQAHAAPLHGQRGATSADLLTLRRTPRHGVAADHGALATAFAEPTSIRPDSGSSLRRSRPAGSGPVPVAPANPIRRLPEQSAPGSGTPDRTGRATTGPAETSHAETASGSAVRGMTAPAGSDPIRNVPVRRWAGAAPHIPGLGTAPAAAVTRAGAVAAASVIGAGPAASGPGPDTAETVLRWARPTGAPAGTGDAADPTAGPSARITSGRRASQAPPAPTSAPSAAAPGVAPGSGAPGIRRSAPAAGPVTPAPAGSIGRARTLTPAPPRGLSSSAPGSNVPPVPAAGGGPAVLRPPPGAVSGSLVDSTAHLFGAAPGPSSTGAVHSAGPPVGAAPPGLLQRLLAQEGGNPMNEFVPGSVPGSVLGSQRVAGAAPAPLSSGAGPLVGPPPVPAVAGSGAQASANAMMDELVDAVVARIEHKVIDELERRGQRQGWAAF